MEEPSGAADEAQGSGVCPRVVMLKSTACATLTKYGICQHLGSSHTASGSSLVTYQVWLPSILSLPCINTPPYVSLQNNPNTVLPLDPDAAETEDGRPRKRIKLL